MPWVDASWGCKQYLVRAGQDIAQRVQSLRSISAAILEMPERYAPGLVGDAPSGSGRVRPQRWAARQHQDHDE
eukprot:4936392-Amphidinium_carterae.1